MSYFTVQPVGRVSCVILRCGRWDATVTCDRKPTRPNRDPTPPSNSTPKFSDFTEYIGSFTGLSCNERYIVPNRVSDGHQQTFDNQTAENWQAHSRASASQWINSGAVCSFTRRRLSNGQPMGERSRPTFAAGDTKH